MWVAMAEGLEVYVEESGVCQGCESTNLVTNQADFVHYCDDCGLTWGGIFDWRTGRELY